MPGGGPIGRMTEDAHRAVQSGETPPPACPRCWRSAADCPRVPADPLIRDKRRQLDRIIQACLGLSVETVVDRAEVVPGETLKLRHTAVVRSRILVRWTAVRYPSLQRAVTKVVNLRPNQPVVRDVSQVLPAATPPSQPYWLRKEGTAGLSRVDDPLLIGRPENPPVLPIEYVFDVGGQMLVIPDEPVPATSDPQHGARHRLDVIPPVSLRFTSSVELFAPGAARPVVVELTAARARAAGTVQVEAPAGWRITPPSQPFHLAGTGDHARFTFTVTAPAQRDDGTTRGQREDQRGAFRQSAHRASLRPHSRSSFSSPRRS